ncbi:MAG: hypothetical protein E7584_00915 [Ruminococcaceae bacterium]|nr:hypothetical protein [Oscillospiraceae bacterium]
MDIIFALALLLIVALSVVWSVFVRKLAKTRIKSICVIASVLLALIGTIVVKTVVIDPNFVKGTLLPVIPSLPAQVMDLVNSSDLLLEFIVGLPVALIAPLIFVILYVVFYLLTSIIYLFILIFAGKAIKKSNAKNVPYAKARSIAWSAVSAALALLVILIPVAFYGDLADDVVGVVADMDAVDAETQDMINSVSKDYIKPIAGGTTVSLFRAIGGDMLIDEMTSITIEGEVIYLKSELDAIVDLAGNVMPLTKDGAPNSYGEEEADSLVAAVNSLTDSKFLTTIASEAIYLLTDDMVNGEADMPMADNEMFGNLITDTVTIVHDDAKETDKFTADLKTVAQMASELIKGGVLANMDDTDALMDELAGGSTIKNVILVLGENNSMKCLIPEVTNIGIKAIANAVEVKEDEEAVYNELMSTIAADLNSVKNETDETKKVYDLSLKLTNAFDTAGIAIDKQVIHLYSAAMIQGIINEKGGEEVVAADVQAFFVAYAESADKISTPTLAGDDENANSAPAILARLVYNLSNVDVNKPNFDQESVANMIAAEALALLGTTESDLYDIIVEGKQLSVEGKDKPVNVGPIKLKKNLDTMFVNSDENPKYDYAIQKKFYSTSTFANTVALQSAAAMKEKSLLIFMDEIVIDVDEAAKLITDQTKEQEAEAIGGIFSKAGSLMDDLSGEKPDIGTMATSVGSILNSLNDSVSVGEERTTNLFIAIIQSSMVRDAAKMDIGTATQLGVKGTHKNADGSPVDYEKTFKTISNTMDVLQQMSSTDPNSGMENADLSVVLKDLNPQTAGMIESYITEDRLQEDYALDAEQSATAAPLISDVFGYMGSADMTEEECEREAAALNDVMTLVTGASDRAAAGETTGQTVFGNDPNTSIMGKDAVDTVNTFMASKSLKHSLDENNREGTLEEDPFGLSEMMKHEDPEKESKDKTDLIDAMNTHYRESEDRGQDKKDLNNLGKLFGLSEEDMLRVFDLSEKND